MQSPLYTFPSDYSTPKPQFYKPEELTQQDFFNCLHSLKHDINQLGSEVENLRSENLILQAKIEVVEKEKAKHVRQHAKEKAELEKALLYEKNLKKQSWKELEELKLRYEVMINKSYEEKNEKSFKGLTSPKSFNTKIVKHHSGTNLRSKITKIEKEHTLMKKQIKNLETVGINKSSILRWNED